MIAGASRVSAVIFLLDFDVVLPPVRIPHENIKRHGASVKIRHFFLRVHLENGELRLLQDDAQDVLHRPLVILQTGVKERVVHEAEFLDGREHFLAILLRHTMAAPLLSSILLGNRARFKEKRSPNLTACIVKRC